jgi:hypothetical protein
VDRRRVLLADDILVQVGIFVVAPIAGLIALACAAAVVHTVERALDWRASAERKAAVNELRERRAAVVSLVNELLASVPRPVEGAL